LSAATASASCRSLFHDQQQPRAILRRILADKAADLISTLPNPARAIGLSCGIWKLSSDRSIVHRNSDALRNVAGRAATAQLQRSALTNRCARSPAIQCHCKLDKPFPPLRPTLLNHH